jgi:Ca2+-binding EF-hand superfamily protein
MNAISSLEELEKVFIQKLSEKVQLNERSLRKAFSKFDLDKTGLLDLNEMQHAIQHFLHGVDPNFVLELVKCYDTNGDGKISYHEFLHFLNTKSAVKSATKRSNESFYDDDIHRSLSDHEIEENDYADYCQDQIDGGRRNMNSYSNIIKKEKMDSADSDIVSEMDPTNGREIEYRAKVFLQNLKGAIYKAAIHLRNEGQVKGQIAMTTAELSENVACTLLLKHFQPYTGLIFSIIILLIDIY